ncbi:hypothetical protein COCON_G00207720 [Conger conger]|uniref:Uncharacterized protein n=1 Tax=Conger conger TaxID=82655 RepID=A0A9Q1CZP3_CONCO|nr:hypothetical protein COCON_G00207720 [Conger conger]
MNRNQKMCKSGRDGGGELWGGRCVCVLLPDPVPSPYWGKSQRTVPTGRGRRTRCPLACGKSDRDLVELWEIVFFHATSSASCFLFVDLLPVQTFLRWIPPPLTLDYVLLAFV